MKKLNAKFIASVVMAGIVASAVAVSASATDYVWAPGYAPASTSSTTGTSSNTQASTDTTNTADEKDTTESKGATVADDSKITDAIKTGKAVDVAVDDDGDAIIQEAAIGEIAKGDKAVTFDVSDDNSDTDYQIVIDPELITEVKAINLAMKITIPTSDDDFEGVDVPAGSIVIEPMQKGRFGMTLEIVLPAAALEDIDLTEAALYYISDDGDVELVEDGLVVNDDDTASVFISHASAYVISDVDLTAGEVEIGEPDDDDDNGITIDEPSNTETGKNDNSVVVNGNGADTNPVTGTTLALGSLAVFAAAAVATSKKRK